MQTVCLCLNEDQHVKWKNKDSNDPSKGKEQDYWEYAKKYLLNNKLIKKIQGYREEKIKIMQQKQVEKIKLLISKPELQKDKVFKVSEPAGNMCMWIR